MNSEVNREKASPPALPIVISVLLVVCCCLVVLVAGAGYLFFRYQPNPVIIPTLGWTNYQPTNTPFESTRIPVDRISSDSLHLLEQTVVPDNDYPELVCHFKGICNVPLTLTPPTGTLAVGTQEQFWVTNADTPPEL